MTPSTSSSIEERLAADARRGRSPRRTLGRLHAARRSRDTRTDSTYRHAGLRASRHASRPTQIDGLPASRLGDPGGHLRDRGRAECSATRQEEPARRTARASHHVPAPDRGDASNSSDSVATALSGRYPQSTGSRPVRVSRSLAQQLQPGSRERRSTGEISAHFGRGDMVAPFEDRGHSPSEPGEISDVVETPMGLHIIRLDERRVRGFEEAVAAQYRRNVQASGWFRKPNRCS